MVTSRLQRDGVLSKEVLALREKNKEALAKGGAKFDEGKVRMDLLPPDALEGIAIILTYGANKYAPRNWEKGMAWGKCFGGLLRHLFAWWRGQDKDPETGYSHLWHAGCMLTFLIAYERRGIGTDDRFKLTNV